MYTGIPGKVHAIVHMENIPATTMLLELDQDQTTGKLTTTKATHMDWTKYGGISSPCAGSLSPWNTHLGSEEWGPPDSRAEEDCTSCDCVHKYGRAMMAYLDKPEYTTCTNYTEWRAAYDEHYYTHYRYHFPWESGIDGVGTKHMSMGRRGMELLYAMPDEKTVYMSDDTENGFLSVFKADTAKDLSAGTLWCAVVEQVADDSTIAGGSFTIKEWKDMGHATTADIEPHVMGAPYIRFYDMFETETPADAAPWCSAGFTAINVGGLGLECLKVKPGKEKLASRLESRRYAAMLGCTVEFSKMEGITYSTETGMLYIGMTMVRRGMENNTHANDKGSPNHIRLTQNKCGCVYELDVDPDTYLVTTMKGLICGKLSDPEDPDNLCDVNTIANPDNVAAMHGHKMLLIAEDTTYHYNNILWLYDLEKRQLAGRIGATPDLAEVCSPYFYPDVGGFSYITMVMQHPNLTSYGASAIGYVAWPRDCSVDYPAFSMPGHGSATRCAGPAPTPSPDTSSTPAPTPAPSPAPATDTAATPAPATTTAASTEASPAAQACMGFFAAALAILSFTA
jgi:secreted PhoX family phosphatase